MSIMLTCKNKRVRVNWLAFNYLYKYKGIHAIKLVALKSLLKTDIKVDMTLTQIRRADVLIVEKFQGYLKEEHGRFLDYCDEIEGPNPRSTTQLKVNNLILESLPIFE